MNTVTATATENITETISELLSNLVKYNRINSALIESNSVGILTIDEYIRKNRKNQKQIRITVAKLKKSIAMNQCTHFGFTSYYCNDGMHLRMEPDDVTFIKFVYDNNVNSRVDAYQKCRNCKTFVSITRTTQL